MRDSGSVGPGSSKRALVLGGGGGLGMVQAAYIQAAYEAGFRADLIVGTSAGALNGAFMAIHPDDPEGLLTIWRGLARHKVLRLNPVLLAGRIARRRRGICRNDIVPYLLREHVRGLRFEDAVVPLSVVATNLTLGEKHVFRSGALAPAIAASTAIPGVFDPCEIDGELFVDGCVTATLDLQTALEQGATEILAIDLTPRLSEAMPRTPVGILRRSFGILSHSTTDAMYAAAAAQVTTRVLRPNVDALSPWRIAVSDREISARLAEARLVMRDLFDTHGHVRALTPARPLEPVPFVHRARPRLRFSIRRPALREQPLAG